MTQTNLCRPVELNRLDPILPTSESESSSSSSSYSFVVRSPDASTEKKVDRVGLDEEVIQFRQQYLLQREQERFLLERQQQQRSHEQDMLRLRPSKFPTLAAPSQPSSLPTNGQIYPHAYDGLTSVIPPMSVASSFALGAYVVHRLQLQRVGYVENILNEGWHVVRFLDDGGSALLHASEIVSVSIINKNM